MNGCPLYSGWKGFIIHITHPQILNRSDIKPSHIRLISLFLSPLHTMFLSLCSPTLPRFPLHQCGESQHKAQTDVFTLAGGGGHWWWGLPWWWWCRRINGLICHLSARLWLWDYACIHPEEKTPTWLLTLRGTAVTYYSARQLLSDSCGQINQERDSYSILSYNFQAMFMFRWIKAGIRCVFHSMSFFLFVLI